MTIDMLAPAPSAAPLAPISPVADWLIRKGLTRGTTASLIHGVSLRIVESGVPLWRLNFMVQTLHPQSVAALYRWTEGEEKIWTFQPPRGELPQYGDRFKNSPFKVVFETGIEIRRRLEGPDAVIDFPILPDLIKEGATDYIVLPVRFSDGQVNAITCTTRRAGGFTDHDIVSLRRAIRALVGPLEVMQMRELSRTLLDTYLGRNAGGRVLDGVIDRGAGDVIRAVIWYCDLRNFTGMSENLPMDAMIRLLNDYFEAVGAPIQEVGGEILKFVGDAILAIFPITDGCSATEACARALGAATAAQGRMAALNAERAAHNGPPLGFGITLHVGDVIYGNIGTPDRLDFTVIGPAVNLVTRMEDLTKELKQPMLVSDLFAELSGADFTPMGAHSFQGIPGPRAIFAPRAA